MFPFSRAEPDFFYFKILRRKILCFQRRKNRRSGRRDKFPLVVRQVYAQPMRGRDIDDGRNRNRNYPMLAAHKAFPLIQFRSGRLRDPKVIYAYGESNDIYD